MSAPSLNAGHWSQGIYSGCSELAESISVDVLQILSWRIDSVECWELRGLRFRQTSSNIVEGIEVCQRTGCTIGKAWQRWEGRIRRHVG